MDRPKLPHEGDEDEGGKLVRSRDDLPEKEPIALEEPIEAGDPDGQPV